ncbi:hypothetical protein J7T55_002505 [Diaporthe amygdali]|uniref:uncharacterized protein n=1 Tax=Phomopsis amygdali TaxID=1214568 RepID=UPI0022FE39B4|nr:uncharacterized protein J7T55_002505 [Diaporthe amygdali]KAJ0121994.1 hypothetical protein J7T55_002505 [Diaporthe amygdali]
MQSLIMSSITPTEFLYFPKLPVELRRMVWDQALPATLDFQRFNAEIAHHPNCVKSNKSESLVLCLTPHDDFVHITSGYRGLLGACKESNTIASVEVPFHLPINYLAPDANGSLIVRFASVPFNPDGQLCISGLGPALHAASEGDGARGMDLRWSYWPDNLAEDIKCASFPKIKNLTIALDSAKDSESEWRFLRGWDDRAFHKMALRMINLETVALVDEEALDLRQKIDAETFNSMHKPAPVVRPSEDDDGWNHDLDEPSAVRIPWVKLYADLQFDFATFKFINRYKTLSHYEAWTCDQSGLWLL